MRKYTPLSEDEINLYIIKGYNLNDIDVIRKQIDALSVCGIDAAWIRELGMFQLTSDIGRVRTYIDADKFTAENAVREIINYNISAWMKS